MIDDLLRDQALLSAVRRARPDDDPANAIVRVVWNVLTEPGDGIAGALIAELGAEESLRFALAEGGQGRSDGGRSYGGRVDSGHEDELGVFPAGPRSRALADARARWRPRADPRAVADAVASAEHVSARMLLPGDPLWPCAVDDLGAHAPTMLWVRGDAGLLTVEPRVSVVGARASSGYGELLAGEFAGDLAASGAVIVSGGAYGIDGAAHRAALAVGGATVALLAGGVDRAYPQGHQQLLSAIVASGAVVSEVPCGTAPTKWRFLSRNRLIAALGDATVVVEAGWRSGSLNTAGHAAALGRPLGAVPGPVTSAASAGCHRLLREYDARCVTTAAEIRELWGEAEVGDRGQAITDPEELRLLDAMSSRTRASAPELARRSGLSIDRATAMLGILELDGRVERDAEGWRRAASPR